MGKNYRAYYKMYVQEHLGYRLPSKGEHWLFIEGCWMAGVEIQDCALMLLGRTP